MTAFLALTRAQLKSFLRDRQTLFWVIAFPLMFLVLFGGIFSDRSSSRVTIVTTGPLPLIERMPERQRSAFDHVFKVVTAASADAALRKVRKGDVAGFLEQEGSHLTLHFSRADQTRAAIAQSAMQSFTQAATGSAAGGPPATSLTTDQVEDTSLKPIQYVTPGLLGWAVAMGATFGAAMTLVTWRTTKLLRRLRLAPMRTETLVASRTLVSTGIAAVQVFVFIGVAVALFGLKLRGSWWMAVPLVVCGALAFMAIGLLTGSIARTAEGASGIANLIVMPMAFLSGSFIPLDNAPAWVRTTSRLLPLGHLNKGLTDVMVRGQGPGAAVRPMLVLLSFAIAVGLVASRVFRWEKD